jgi:hypothetical protein
MKRINFFPCKKVYHVKTVQKARFFQKMFLKTAFIGDTELELELEPETTNLSKVGTGTVKTVTVPQHWFLINQREAKSCAFHLHIRINRCLNGPESKKMTVSSLITFLQ